MAEYLDVLFSDFAPDRGGAPWPENSGYLVDATNVRFTPNGYRSTYIDAAAPGTLMAVGATPIAAVAYAQSTQPRHYVGTASKLFESDDFGINWYDNSSAGYTATDWDFALFGTTVIAVNATNPPQAKSLTAAVANNFANLGGSPPVGSRVARIRDSLVLGNFTPSDVSGLQWSSIGDPTDWPTPGSATALARQAGSVSLSGEYGSITDLVGGEKFGLAFQERAITRMTYVGGDIQFTFDVFEKGQGTGYSHSAIYVGGFIYYLNSTGIHRTDGYQVQNLSLGKVDDAFILKLLSHPHQTAAIYNGVAYDPRTKSVCWSVLDWFSAPLLICYDIPLNQFRIVELAGTISDGTLYSVHDGSSINTAHVIPHCIGTDQKLRQFTDLADVPTLLRTGFLEFEPGLITEITGIEVLGANISAQPDIAVRSEYDSSDLDLADSGYMPAEKTSTNLYKVRTAGRFHSLRYADSAQSAAALARGLRVYYEIKSGR